MYSAPEITGSVLGEFVIAAPAPQGRGRLT